MFVSWPTTQPQKSESSLTCAHFNLLPFPAACFFVVEFIVLLTRAQYQAPEEGERGHKGALKCVRNTNKHLSSNERQVQAIISRGSNSNNILPEANLLYKTCTNKIKTRAKSSVG